MYLCAAVFTYSREMHSQSLERRAHSRICRTCSVWKSAFMKELLIQAQAPWFAAQLHLQKSWPGQYAPQSVCVCVCESRKTKNKAELWPLKGSFPWNMTKIFHANMFWRYNDPIKPNSANWKWNQFNVWMAYVLDFKMCGLL